jgi:predicted phosphodiesterase
MRRFVIGDIHGRVQALKEVLEKCSFDKKKDRLIVLGDVVDGDYLDEEQWKMAVQSGNTTSGYDDWVNEVRDDDGRGSIINRYDASEEEETINNTTYYIYRTN